MHLVSGEPLLHPIAIHDLFFTSTPPPPQPPPPPPPPQPPSPSTPPPSSFPPPLACPLGILFYFIDLFLLVSFVWAPRRAAWGPLELGLRSVLRAGLRAGPRAAFAGCRPVIIDPVFSLFIFQVAGVNQRAFVVCNG